MKKKNKWGRHKKVRSRRYYGFPPLHLLSYDGLGNYHRITEEERRLWVDMRENYNPKDREHNILGYMKKYGYSWEFVYNVVHDKQV